VGDVYDLTNYSKSEREILNDLASVGDVEATHSALYIAEQGIHIKLGSPMDIRNIGGAGWWDKENIYLSPRHYKTLENLDAWGTSLVSHEARHIEQGGPTTQFDELDAWQRQSRIADKLGEYGNGPIPPRDLEVSALPLKRDAKTIAAFGEILKKNDFWYWVGFSFQPPGIP